MTEPLLLDATRTAELIGIGRTLFYEMNSSGRLGPMPREFQSKKLWSIVEIHEWIRAGCPSREVWLKMQGAGSG